MRIIVSSQTYYRTAEACEMAGVSRSTLRRWLKRGILEDAAHRDRRGWRLFTPDDIKRIKTKASRIPRGGGDGV
jgi:excisionase family DNA binding protein